MAKRYEHASVLSQEIRARRHERSLSYGNLGVLAGVDGAQAFRICRGEFRTLNPSVLKICNVLHIQPEPDGLALHPSGAGEMEAMLSAEVLTAWDRTDSGAIFLKRVLRALNRNG